MVAKKFLKHCIVTNIYKSIMYGLWKSEHNVTMADFPFTVVRALL